MSVITVSLVPCNDAIADQDFSRRSIAHISCGGTFSNFNKRSNQPWMTKSKTF